MTCTPPPPPPGPQKKKVTEIYAFITMIMKLETSFLGMKSASSLVDPSDNEVYSMICP